MAELVLVTGASGFVGGHVAERLVAAGRKVRTVVRTNSRIEVLERAGVELVRGDLNDPATLQRACKGVAAVVHVAALVGEDGPLEDYRKANVQGLGLLMDACPKDLRRFVLISSLGVYPARDHHGTDETCPPPPMHIDGYTQSKAEADQLALRRAAEGFPVTILRPGFVYGPRDRTVLPRILANLKAGRVTYFGSPQKKLNQIYVGNIADAALLALEQPTPGGIYNLTDAEPETKERFFNGIADRLGLPRPKRKLPMWLGKLLVPIMGRIAKRKGTVPLLTAARLKFMGLNLEYSIARARKELGYNPAVGFDEGMDRTIAWLKAEGLA